MPAGWPTSTDMATLLRRTFSPAEVAAADLVLQGVIGTVKRAARQQLELVTNDVVQLPGVWEQTLRLPQRPVVAVTAVSLRDPAGVAIALVETRDYVWSRLGLLQRIGFIARIPRSIEGYWGGPAATVTVTYSHGYASIPDDVRAIVLAAAVREFGNPEGDTEESIGNYAVKHSAADAALLGSERKALSNYGRAAR
jgi:hypothetical protein